MISNWIRWALRMLITVSPIGPMVAVGILMAWAVSGECLGKEDFKDWFTPSGDKQ